MTMRWGHSVADNPIRAPWPELADISISNHCTKGCSFCYKNSTANNIFMTAEEYRFVLNSLTSKQWGSVFQVALGGGEPLEHPEFESILKITRKAGVIPNFTTNGLYLDQAAVKVFGGLAGSAALSTSSAADIDPKKIGLLKGSATKANLHFVVSRSSLEDATNLLKGRYNDLLTGVNSIIFLTYKPAGRASADDCLVLDDQLRAFISLVDRNDCCARIGFDACFVPLLLSHTKINVDFIDPCECGFFSIYVDERRNVKPCSFSDDSQYCFSLDTLSMQDIWENRLAAYRHTVMNNTCSARCEGKSFCRGACLFYHEVSLCFTS